jgi:hypothetical protein
VPEDVQCPDPPGASLAREIEIALRRAGLDVSSFENWRDSGWSIDARVNDHRFQVFFAVWDEPRWLLGIDVLDRVGIVAWLLGRRAPDTSNEVRRLARAIHEALRSLPYVSELSWDLRGPPDPARGVPTPDDLPWA